jgi:hypothetical protein
LCGDKSVSFSVASSLQSRYNLTPREWKIQGGKMSKTEEKSKTFRVQVEFALQTKEDYSAEEVRRGVKSEWWLINGNGTIPIGKTPRFVEVRYSKFDVRVTGRC